MGKLPLDGSELLLIGNLCAFSGRFEQIMDAESPSFHVSLLIDACMFHVIQPKGDAFSVFTEAWPH